MFAEFVGINSSFQSGTILRHLLLAKSKFSRFEKTDNTGVVHKIYIPVYQEQIPINT